jgi:hypothetical protein
MANATPLWETAESDCGGPRLNKEQRQKQRCQVPRIDCVLDLSGYYEEAQAKKEQRQKQRSHTSVPRLDCTLELTRPDVATEDMEKDQRKQKRTVVPRSDCVLDLPLFYEPESPEGTKGAKQRSSPEHKHRQVHPESAKQRSEQKHCQVPRLDCMLELPLVADDSDGSELEEMEEMFPRQISESAASDRFSAKQKHGQPRTLDSLPGMTDDFKHLPTIQPPSSLPLTSHKVEAKEILELARAHNWHVVSALDEEAQGSLRAEMELRQVPKDATAILVLCATQCFGQASLHEPCKLISALTAVGERLPVIAVLLRPELADIPRMEAILRAQDSLNAAGADDVILTGGLREDLRCDVHMSLVRAQRRLSKDKQLKNHVRHVEELQDGMWKSVQRMNPQFPAVKCVGPATVGHGTRVGDCTFFEKLGAGAVGDVYFARNNRLGRDEAVKVIHKGSLRRAEHALRICSEVDLLKRLAHPNIPAAHSLVHTSSFLFIHMGCAGQRNLYCGIEEAGGRLNVATTRSLAAQVTQAVAHCHEKGIAHCDIKPENIVLSDCGTRAQLVDFGSATKTCNSLTGFRGTMPFMAPEILAGKPYQPATADTWSAGLVVLEMLCGTRKLNRIMGWPGGVRPDQRLHQELVQAFGQESELLMKSLENDGVDPSSDLLSMLHGALDVSPASRSTAKQLSDSEWFSAS